MSLLLSQSRSHRPQLNLSHSSWMSQLPNRSHGLSSRLNLLLKWNQLRKRASLFNSKLRLLHSLSLHRHLNLNPPLSLHRMFHSLFLFLSHSPHLNHRFLSPGRIFLSLFLSLPHPHSLGYLLKKSKLSIQNRYRWRTCSLRSPHALSSPLHTQRSLIISS